MAAQRSDGGGDGGAGVVESCRYLEDFMQRPLQNVDQSSKGVIETMSTLMIKAYCFGYVASRCYRKIGGVAAPYAVVRRGPSSCMCGGGFDLIVPSSVRVTQAR